MEKYIIFVSGFVLGYYFNRILNTNNKTEFSDDNNKYRNKKRYHY